MKDEDKRVVIAFYAIVNSKESITCNQLAKICGVSERTIKSDLLSIKEYAYSKGCEVNTKKGKGISYSIVDNDVYLKNRDELDIKFSAIDVRYSSSASRRNEVLRYLISQNDYFKLDDLADSLFISKSTIKNELVDIKKYLKSFRLELVSRPGKGVIIKGDELNKRLCMLELYEIHFPYAKTTIENEGFLRFFKCDTHIRKEIRKSFLKVHRSSSNVMLDLFINRMVYYLILAKNRFQEGFEVEIGTMYLNLLKSFKEYKLAKEIIEELINIDAFDLPENEILAIELLLLNWIDMGYQEDNKKNYSLFYDEAKTISIEMFDRVKKECNIDFNDSENSIEIMIAGVIPIVTKVFFNSALYDIKGKQIERNGIRNSPLSIKFAHISARVFKEKYACDLTEHDINMIALRYYALIDKTSYQYEKRKIIVCCRNGHQGGEILKDKIKRRFNNKWFESIDIFNLYQVRNIDESQYHYIVMDYDPYAYKYSLPFMKMSQIPTNDQMQDFYSKVILGGFHIKELYMKSGLNKVEIIKSFYYESKKSFIQFISYRFAQANEEYKMIEYLGQEEIPIIQNEVAVLFIPTKSIKSNKMEIYKLQKPEKWDEQLISYIIVLTVDFEKSSELCHFIERATSILVSNPSCIDDLVNSNDVYGQYLELLYDNIKTS